jgi:hypothetical protein
MASATGLFVAITMLTGTSPSQTLYQYQCGASARLADNFILAPEAPNLFFSIDIPLNAEKVAENDSAMNDPETAPLSSEQREEASFLLAGRYMTGTADTDAANEDITLKMSKWQAVPDDLCDESADGSTTDTGIQPDTGDVENTAEDGSFQFSWVDGECYGWNEFQSMPLLALTDENSAAFEFTAVVEEPWGRDVVFRLTLEGNGHASIDFNFTHTLYEMQEFEASPGPQCGRSDQTPDRSSTRDSELCSMLQVDSWSWTEEDDPTP